VTPKSPSVLPSITNLSLQQIAKDMGMTVSVRPVPLSELDDFDEVIACGTAVVVTPVNELTLGDKVYKFGSDEVGEVTMELYRRVREIQQGKAPDNHGWLEKVC
jgi:branched-chain amino acid aminotransferase